MSGENAANAVRANIKRQGRVKRQATTELRWLGSDNTDADSADKSEQETGGMVLAEERIIVCVMWITQASRLTKAIKNMELTLMRPIFSQEHNIMKRLTIACFSRNDDLFRGFADEERAQKSTI